jgi:predicted TIM-barrel fold metal-dependent hydrolase
MTVDVATFIGPYPFRALERTSAADLLASMDRVGVDEAWVGHLAAFLHRDPAPTNEGLYEALDHTRLRCVPTVDPGIPEWHRDLERARHENAAAIRVYPVHQGVPPDGSAMSELVIGAGTHGLPVVLTVRFEDVRQRHPLDTAGDLPAAAVRHLARVDDTTRLIVTHASREYIEEVHFGLTPEEASRVYYDISWLWGPPADDLDVLCKTVGVSRFLYGSGFPLRIAEAPGARLDLTDLDASERSAIESGNAQELVRACDDARSTSPEGM